MNPQEEIPELKPIVEKVLEQSDAAKNSDKELYRLVVKEVTGIEIPFLEWNEIMAVSFESVRRTRQKFNEAQMYLPTNKDVAKQRGRNAAAMRKFMPGMEVD